MLDYLRNAVMKRFIALLIKMGYNTLELYTEDTMDLKASLALDVSVVVI